MDDLQIKKKIYGRKNIGGDKYMVMLVMCVVKYIVMLVC